ncbi:hypothetical protein J3F83DRAFT_321567 [Trichoderma novae-zelandiae]
MGIVNNGVQAAKARRKDNPGVPPHFLITIIDQPMHQQINNPLLAVSGTSVRRTSKLQETESSEDGTVAGNSASRWTAVDEIRESFRGRSRQTAGLRVRIHQRSHKARSRGLSKLPGRCSACLKSIEGERAVSCPQIENGSVMASMVVDGVSDANREK